MKYKKPSTSYSPRNQRNPRKRSSTKRQASFRSTTATTEFKSTLDSFLGTSQQNCHKIREELEPTLIYVRDVLGEKNPHVKSLNSKWKVVCQLCQSIPKSPDDPRISALTDRDVQLFVGKVVRAVRESAAAFISYEQSLIGTCLELLQDELNSLHREILENGFEANAEVRGHLQELMETVETLQDKFQKVHGDAKIKHFLEKIVDAQKSLNHLRVLVDMVEPKSSVTRFLGKIILPASRASIHSTAVREE